jgi:Sulfotransferase family
MRFVQVVRDGRDIAFARNQNQVDLYGDIALGAGPADDPVRRIRFWAWANDRARNQGAELLGDHCMCVRLEDLCHEPEAEVRRILRFAHAADGALPVDEIAPPASLGRGRQADPELVARLEAAAGATLSRFGYL